MINTFKIGDIVENGNDIVSIISIDSAYVKLDNGRLCIMKDLEPVKINEEIGYKVALECDNPVRAKILNVNQEIPKMSWSLSFLGSYINTDTVASIVDEHKMYYLHELQSWISKNAPEYHLIVRKSKASKYIRHK